MGFHSTGMPIKACADKLVNGVKLFGQNFERYADEDAEEDKQILRLHQLPTMRMLRNSQRGCAQLAQPVGLRSNIRPRVQTSLGPPILGRELSDITIYMAYYTIAHYLHKISLARIRVWLVSRQSRRLMKSRSMFLLDESLMTRLSRKAGFRKKPSHRCEENSNTGIRWTSWYLEKISFLTILHSSSTFILQSSHRNIGLRVSVRTATYS